MPFPSPLSLTPSDRSKAALAQLYHRGQAKAWVGPERLAEVLQTHGRPNLPEDRRHALRQLLTAVLWGELAAWEIASTLSAQLDSIEARMGATAQAHDEARHYTVMRGWLDELGGPAELTPASQELLGSIAGARSIAKRLLGMHLMVEPVALTLFQLLRERDVDPALTALVSGFEADEARHIALGVHLLPLLLDEMGPLRLAHLWQWQIRMYMLEVESVRELEGPLAVLGIAPIEVLRLGQAKQVAASEAIVAHLDRGLPITDVFLRLGEARFVVAFPEPGWSRMETARRAFAALKTPPPQARGDKAKKALGI